MKTENESNKVDEVQGSKSSISEERIYQGGSPAIYKEYDENGNLIGGGVIVEDRKYAVTTPKEGISERLKSVLTADGRLNGEFQVRQEESKVEEVAVYQNGVRVQQVRKDDPVVMEEGVFENGSPVPKKGLYSVYNKSPKGNDR